MDEVHKCKLNIQRSIIPVKPSSKMEGKQRRGRQQRRWRDDVKENTKLGWKELSMKVRDREEWTTCAMSDVYCKSCGNISERINNS